MKEKTAALSSPAGGLPFGRFFARWMRFRRDDMLAMLLFPAGFWLLIVAVVLIAAAVEGEPFDASAFAIPTAMALVGGVFAGFITGIGSAGVCFTLTVCWGHSRRQGVASLWLSGILYSAANLLLAAVLQGLGLLLGRAAGVPQGMNLLAVMPVWLWLILLVAPTAGAVLLKASLRRFGPKAGSWLYLIFMVACIGIPNLDEVLGVDLTALLFAVLGVGLAAAAVVSSLWLLRAPVGGD